MSTPRSVEPPASFKACTHCGQEWRTRDDFLSDPTISIIGYQAFVRDAVLGLYLFNHTPCETTLAIQAGPFEDLHEGPVYSEALHGTEQCLGACPQNGDLRPCPNECECAWARDVLQTIRNWPKTAPAT